MAVLTRSFIAALLLLACSLGATGAEQAPDFILPRLDNQQSLSLSSLRGKVVYVDFWASWCAPCAVSLPALQQLHDELNPQGFEVVAINLDEHPSHATQFLASRDITYAVVFDADKTTPQRYRVAGMPTAFLVDRQGMLRATHTGFKSGDQQKLKQQIQQLLQENPL